MKRTLSVLILLVLIAFGSGLAQVQKPSDLKFAPLTFNPPDPQAFRTVYAGGLRAYVKEDRDLPIVTVTALLHFGSLDLPKDKLGLDSIMSQALIRGGTKTREGTAIEERLDFLGGSLSFNVGERTSTLILSVQSKDLDEGLDLFFDVLRNPEFREAPLSLAKMRQIEGLRQINDQPGQVLNREFEKAIYGDNPLTWQASRKTLEAVTAADLKAVHAQYFYPKNIILAASGDFAKAELKAKIEKRAAGWKNGAAKFPAVASSFPAPEPGVYFVQKPINQGYISIGHLGVEESNPDYYAIQVMNFILGGGSFTSRITTKVRSDEGLSYNQGSRFTTRWGFPGTFSGYVQTKSSTVGYAISLILDEMNRIRTQPVTDAEMETAVNYYLDSFSSQFEISQAIVSNFANMEMTGRPMDTYKTYRSRIQAVTKAKVQEVARKYIQPDKAVIMIVGDFEPCNKGGEKWPGPLDKLGKVHRVTLIDPMTGEPAK